jgi:hypothetical protein
MLASMDSDADVRRLHFDLVLALQGQFVDQEHLGERAK